MWLIAVILVTVPSVTSFPVERFFLTASDPIVTFTTTNYPNTHNTPDERGWVVTAPGNVAELKLTCDIDIINSTRGVPTLFSYRAYDSVGFIWEQTKLSKTIKGSKIFLKFKSTMSENSVYKGILCTVSYNPDAIPTDTTPADPSCTCGDKIGKRIIDGKETIPNDYPWMALLVNRQYMQHFCGGSLIATQWVLSAAHCITFDVSLIVVGLGEHDIRMCGPVAQYFELSDIIKHEDYGLISKYDNDIALLKLAKPVRFNQFISPICLPFNYKSFDFTNKNGIVTSWGKNIFGDLTSSSKVLKETEVKIIMWSRCATLDGYKWLPQYITENIICGLAKDGLLWFGDSGSPMVWKSDSSDHYFQLGIVTSGQTDDNSSHPTIFARVSHFVGWIMEKTGAGDELCVKI